MSQMPVHPTISIAFKPEVRRLIWAIGAISLGAQLGGLFLPLIEPDEALYAVISRELSTGKSWAALTLHGEPWLDKPHFPFWCAALSMRFLGASEFAYRLPGFLFYVMGVAYVYSAGRRFFEPGVARWAALVTLTAYHLVFSNHDVRAEAYLVGLVTAALFHLAAAGETRRVGHALAAGFFVGLSVITKGPFLIFCTAGAGVVASLIVKRPPRLAQIVAFSLALLAPVGAEMAALVIQHGDAHAIWALFWEGQFNRFTYSGPGLREGGPFFFVHTLVWAFAPWFPTLAVFTLSSLYGLKTAGRARLAQVSFARATFYSSAVLALVLFSITRFQLPYYFNFEMPMLALMVGAVIVKPADAPGRRVAVALQFVLTGVALLVVAAVLILAEVPHWWVGLVLLFLPVAVFPLLRAFPAERAWLFSALAGCAGALALNFVFYPWLFRFEAGYNAGRTLPTHDETHVHSVGHTSYAYYFYASPRVHMLSLDEASQWRLPSGSLLYLNASDAPAITRSGFAFDVVERFRGTAVSQPRAPFLNPATRQESLHETLVIRSK